MPINMCTNCQEVGGVVIEMGKLESKQHVSSPMFQLIRLLTCRLEDYSCTKQRAGPDRLANSMIRHTESLPFRLPALCRRLHPLKNIYITTLIRISLSACKTTTTTGGEDDDIIIKWVLSGVAAIQFSNNRF